jgi:NADH-quinone oxidoreductase subunit H
VEVLSSGLATMVDPAIAFAKAVAVFVVVLHLTVVLLWVERKGSALIQDRIGANRAAVFGVLPWNTGLVNTLMADPVKMFTKEDFVPAGADRFLHALAPFLAVFPVFVTFAAIPFGDAIVVAGREIRLQVAELDAGLLYILAVASLAVYGIVLGGWASNNRWALLGGLRGSAQMISYEVAMGLSLVSVVLTYGTLDLQEMVRAQGRSLADQLGFGAPVLSWVPAWGAILQPVAFLVLFVAGIAESKSELISGYFTEYSGGKQAAFMFADFAEIVLVSGLVVTFFFGGWQIPFLDRSAASSVAGANGIALLQVGAFLAKVLFFCWLQILIRWTLPRFRYDQLMQLGWKGLLPLSLANVVVTSLAILLAR